MKAMQNSKFIIAAVFITLLLAACFTPNTGEEEGMVAINFGSNGSSRLGMTYPFAPDTALNGMILYKVRFQGTGTPQPAPIEFPPFSGQGLHTFSITPGDYFLSIEAVFPGMDFIYAQLFSTVIPVQIIAGQTISVDADMQVINPVLTSPADISTHYSSLPTGSTMYLAYDLNMGMGGTWDQTLSAIGGLGALVTVDLDLSLCILPGFIFDPVSTLTGGAALGKAKITSLTLPSAVTSITGGTGVSSPSFANFTILETIIAPEVANIGNYAFSTLPLLENVNLPKMTAIGTSAFENCAALVSVDLPLAASIGISAFRNCSALGNVNLPEATLIGLGAFQDCSILSSVNLPKVITIYAYAFQDCPLLDNVYLPKATSLYDNVFQGCTGLTTVSLPLVTAIPQSLFTGCTSLSSVNIPEATTIGVNAFRNCTGLSSIDMPKATTILLAAFEGCTGLGTLIIPKVASIADQAFQSTGTMPLIINMGENAPALLGIQRFISVTGKNVTVRVPVSATGYDTTWQTDFINGGTSITLTVSHVL